MFTIKLPNFDLDSIFLSGQAYRWKRYLIGDRVWYFVPAFNRLLRIEQNKAPGGNYVSFWCNDDDFYNCWYNYFDLGVDYSYFYDALSKTELGTLSNNVNRGVRNLNQDILEYLISIALNTGTSFKSAKIAINRLCTLSERKEKKYSDTFRILWRPFPSLFTMLENQEIFYKIATPLQANICVNVLESIYDDMSIIIKLPKLPYAKCLEVLKSWGYSRHGADLVCLGCLRMSNVFPRGPQTLSKAVKRLGYSNYRDFKDRPLKQLSEAIEGRLLNGLAYRPIMASNPYERSEEAWESWTK